MRLKSTQMYFLRQSPANLSIPFNDILEEETKSLPQNFGGHVIGE